MELKVLLGFALGQYILWAFDVQTPKESIMVVLQVAAALAVLKFVQ